MKRSFATFVVSIARGLCLRDASTIFTILFVGYFVVAMSLAGCGSTSGGVSPIQKTTPTITWAAPAAITYGTALSGTQLNAITTVDGSFAYSPASGTVPAAGTQTLSVTFTPTDSADYNVASGSVQLVVNKATPTITWAAPTPITYGTALSGTQLNAITTVDGSFAYSPASGTVPAAGTQTLSVTFTPTDSADYNVASGSVQLVVNKATPTMSTLPTASAITVGQMLSASTLTGGTASVSGTSVPGTFAWTTPTTVPAVGTDSEGITFTPTDAADYTSVTTDVQLVVNPATPQTTALTPRYVVQDTFSNGNPVSYTVTCAGCQSGDIYHDITSDFPDLTWPSSATTMTYADLWNGLDGTPQFDTNEIKHPGGAYGNQASSAFLGSASQSTLVVSPTTGTLFQVEEQSGQVYWKKTDGTTGQFFSGIGGYSSTQIAVDDTTGKVVRLVTGTSTSSPFISIYDESGDGGASLCQLNPTGMSFISSIAAKDGYMVFTDPVENLVGFAKMDCSGYTTVKVAGQPWSVAMTNNGTETDAYVLSRNECANGIPCVTKIAIPSGTVEGSVDLAGVTPVSTIRATTPNEGMYSVVASNLSSTAFVLFMSDSTDGKVLTLNTNTSNGAKMGIAYTTPITDLPIGIALEESTSNSTLWVAYIAADTMDAITHVGALNPTTGTYTPAIGVCQTGVLAGGFVAALNGVYCAMGSVIAPPLVLQP
jgi:hypothetical protein